MLLLSIVLHALASENDLGDILRRHRSDKATHHQYDRMYSPLFAPMRRKPINILEIGVEDGHSIASWADYFKHPNTNITGLAYKNKLQEHLSDRRMSIVYGSQNDPMVQQRLAKKGNFSIIIDDGSHVPSHQWNTFVALWPVVAPHGLYIIEDIETNYWSSTSSIYGYSLVSEKNIIGNFKSIIDTSVNSEFNTGVDNSEVESISFHRNCIVLRKHGTDHRPRTYRFKHALRGKRLH